MLAGVINECLPLRTGLAVRYLIGRGVSAIRSADENETPQRIEFASLLRSD
jgi:hypothetical protein